MPKEYVLIWIQLHSLNIKKFLDGESYVVIEENVRKENCFIIQPTCRNEKLNISVNDSIMELLIMVDALNGSASSVNVVMPPMLFASR